jgi:hypothetical protein
MRYAIALVFLLIWQPLWATRIFTQTDTSAPQCSQAEAIACSDLSVAESESVGRAVDEGGTAGVSEIQITMANGAANAVCGWFESDQIGEDTAWPAGTWRSRINVTTADEQSIVNMKICRVDSTCGTVKATVGNNSTVTSVNSTGTKSWIISGASQTALTTDLFLVVFDCREDQAHGNSTWGYTPDLNIDTPLTAPAPTVGGKEGLLANPITY